MLLNEKDTEIQSKYDGMTVEELEQQLREAFFYTDQIDEPLAEELEQISKALDKKKPLENEYTIDEYWQRFVEGRAEELAQIGIHDGTKQAEELQMHTRKAAKVQRKHFQTLLRIAVVAAVVIMLLVGVTCVAGALGYDLWGWVPVWNADEVHFIPGTQEPEIVSTISTALDQLGIDELLFPTWLPEGFRLIETRVDTEQCIFHETYKNNDRHLTITITSIDAFGASVYQKGDSPPEEFFVGEKAHYLINNTNSVMAIWNTENYSAVISGNISEEEMKRIVSSVYGEQ